MLSMLMLAASLSRVAAPVLAQSPTSVDASPPPVAIQHSQPTADMQAVLTAMMSLGAQPIETLALLKARLQPSAGDDAHAVMRRLGMSTAPHLAIVTKELPYGDDPMHYARFYKPAATAGAGPLPIIVY